MELGIDGFVHNLNSLMLRGRNFDDWVRILIPLMCVDMGTPELVFNINTDDETTLVKLWDTY